MKAIYLDYAATTPVSPEVLAEMQQAMLEDFGNPSSIHSSGRKANQQIEHAAKILATCLQCSPEEIVFTSGGTEADNLAILGAAKAGKKGRVLYSSIEHPAVHYSCEELFHQGFEPKQIPVDSRGFLNLEQLQSLLTPNTVLVSIMLANNETGAIQPLQSAIEAIRKISPQAIIHTDAVQAFGKIPIDLQQLDVDLLALSAHKIYGPKGCGGLFVRKKTKLQPILFGGDVLRPGTPGVPGIVGFGQAAKDACAHLTEESERLRSLRTQLLDGLLASIPGITINSPQDPARALPNVLNVTFPKKPPVDNLILALDAKGICLSSGSACHSSYANPSRILLSQGLGLNDATNAVRFSFGRWTTEKDIQFCLEALQDIF